ncbi:threonine/serine dehydratase [Klebsiella pneumoniae]|uniref:threonine ammonia-lyase n=1 Tax=Klebsiella pneumoniae TaxID=573 RepID=UPI001ABBEC1B|nr:pyridoxal-phosphate dependent enzyme [Klebsiella pneumoniae]MBO3721250.1 pyridoxal-phosphate dependent enzyme [Klebsiella pneumoniae]HCM5830628.1 pyridoxal-phosphate dependent enzyme [Klebsiella pneumoniae]
MTNYITLSSIIKAAERIENSIIRTPTVGSPGLSELLGRKVFLKLENLQAGGSFKARGVLNLLSAFSGNLKDYRFAAVSGGNFGIAVAEAAKALDLNVTVIMPKNAPASSIEKIRHSGSTVILEEDVGTAFERTNTLAKQGYHIIDDCSDTLVAEGYGTLALELIEDCPSLTDVFVAVGGGAMLAGIATVLKSSNPHIRIWGVETEGANSMYQALKAGKPVNVDITSAISTLGVPVIDRLMLEHAQHYIEKVITVSDNDAIQGMLSFGEKACLWVEPAAGTLIPAVISVIPGMPDNAVIGLIVCGGNITQREMNEWAKNR